MWKHGFVAAMVLSIGSSPAPAQGYVDQEVVASLIDKQGYYTESTPVTWHVYDVAKAGRNYKAVLRNLQAHLDSLPGGQEGRRLQIVELSNRVIGKYIMQRARLLVPDTFHEEFVAYAPYPLNYTGADSLPKLFIVDKYTQTFGAYEHGRLVRWGLVSTGVHDDLTPAGKYSFNWKQEYRESTAAPEGEVWKMRWVFNFQAAAGIHVHQYQLPVAMPASHGCIRLTESDAYWNYHWSGQWTFENGKLKEPGTPIIVLNYNPAGMAAHWEHDLNGVRSLVNLPENPMSLPSGAGAHDKVARTSE